MLTHAGWDTVPGLRHGFLDRADSVGPDWEAVLARLGIAKRVVVPRQVHGTRVVPADGETPVADGVLTTPTGPLVGIVTADCVPVLLLDRGRSVAGAVHAGWRGCAAGILEAAVAALTSQAPSSAIEAVIGPAIGGCCYEVGPEVADAFRQRTGDTTAPAWSVVGARDHVDLRLAARLLLAATGVTGATIIGPCSACGPGYHSFRRDGAGTGRQLSFVGWA